MVFILGISGSPRSDGNTSMLVQKALDAAQDYGAEVKFVELGDKTIEYCDHSGKCYELGECVLEDDLNPIADDMRQAHGIVFGSPAYYSSIPSIMKSLLDRVGRFVNLRGKVGAPLVAGRRSGMTLVVSELIFFMYVKEMIIPGTPFWPIGFALHVGDVLGDTEAIRAAEYSGSRVAEIATLFEHTPASWSQDVPGVIRPAFGDDWR